jgi:Regulator of volume decrease after cellular swelling
MAIDDGDDRVPQILYGESASLKNEPSEYILKVPVPNASWKTDDEVEFDQAPGIVFITDNQVLFQCSQTQDHSVAIDAECIILHAQSEDQVLYLQLQENPSNESEVMEMTLTLTTSDDCERLFQALSHLISQHPVYGDEDDDGMMMMGDYGEDMIVATEVNQSQQPPTEDERNAMLDRLDAMLVIPPHLQDNNNNAEEEEGQFDDADDDIL